MAVAKILFVDDEKNVLRSLQRLLMDDDYDILTASTGEEGLALLDDNPEVPLIISDYRMPGMDGVAFLQQACVKQPDSIRIVLSGFADTASVVAAINDGQIYKFIPKPWNDDDLKVTIEKAVEVYYLHQKNKELAEQLLRSNTELKTLNSGLENLVKERTADLVFQNKALVFSQNILHSLPVAVLGLDCDGLIVQSNKMANEIFAGSGSLAGMSSKAVLPQCLLDLLPQVDPQTLLNERVSVAGGQYLARMSLISPKGTQFGLSVVLVPLSE